ncbi:Uma2 family endonuclease [uncultured Thiohalocapsa sp.]|uniref:Uma2 family endonuclease n=1 Tax=uncultured Thiohalocapsa sp. TaxID=768990 RepID=UPI0025FDBB24|nr:Uma2 family endonuclease [uncultured Thiohalocapsa sp.]
MLAHDLHSRIHRFSVAQFHRMIEAGCFDDGDRVELIDGEMRDMTPIGPPHQGTTDSLTMRFAAALAGRAIVRVQGPVVLDDGTELYPDLSVLQQREDFYRSANPTGDDVLLVIEVADSSLALDQGVKLAKYAHAGIRRYWVVDLRHRTLHDYRDPDRSQGHYRQPQSLTGGSLDIDLAGVRMTLPITSLFAD